MTAFASRSLPFALLALAAAGCSRSFWASAGRAISDAIDDAADAQRPAYQRPALLPETRAERARYLETSRYADVVAFLDSLQRLGAPIWVGAIGRSSEGREIPYVVASRPLVATPAEARRLGRPVVYVQANIHAGEVEGKEALQALVRDLVADPRPDALDSLVLIAVPIYNADGNERVASQSRNRTEQNGPELVGERANGQGLDLNRDYVKAEATETRGSLAMFNLWDPDVFVDLHTTDGSFHGYALTYAPPLDPAAGPAAQWTRDSLLPALRERVRARRGFATFEYGNFSFEYGADSPTDTLKRGWYSYDHRPRFGTNYYGLRNRAAVLSEAYSHDPFERRVRATYAFVAELLSLVAERGARLVELSRDGDALVGSAEGCSALAVRGAAGPFRRCLLVPLRSTLGPARDTEPVVVEDLVRTGDSTLTEPGVPRGLRRTARFRTLQLPVFTRFAPELGRPLPAAYALPGDSGAVTLLRLHGVRVERLTADWRADVETFVIDSVARAPRPFQGHHEVTLVGHWRADPARTLSAGTYLVPTAQPLGVLAARLLEPESDDGLTTWNAFDAALRPGGEHPVVRLVQPVTAPRRAVP